MKFVHVLLELILIPWEKWILANLTFKRLPTFVEFLVEPLVPMEHDPGDESFLTKAAIPDFSQVGIHLVRRDDVNRHIF